MNIRVWRSLVSRLNGVQEAAGSNPVTRTKTENRKVFGLFLYSKEHIPDEIHTKFLKILPFLGENLKKPLKISSAVKQ